MNDISSGLKIFKPNSLTIVMTYYNEEENIVPSIEGALKYLRCRFDDYEVVAVDDCSLDRTLELARQLHANESRINIVALPQNTKFAGALRAGFAAASKDYVFYTDGDCPIDYEDIDRAFPLLKDFDVVVGYRISRDKESWIRKFYTIGYKIVLWLLFGLRFRDINFSFKLFPKNALQSIKIESKGSFIDAEILYKISKAGFKIGEVPVRYHSRTKGVSTLASPKVILKIWMELLSFRLKSLNSGWKPTKTGKRTIDQSNPPDSQR